MISQISSLKKCEVLVKNHGDKYKINWVQINDFLQDLGKSLGGRRWIFKCFPFVYLKLSNQRYEKMFFNFKSHVSFIKCPPNVLKLVTSFKKLHARRCIVFNDSNLFLHAFY